MVLVNSKSCEIGDLLFKLGQMTEGTVKLNKTAKCFARDAVSRTSNERISYAGKGPLTAIRLASLESHNVWLAVQARDQVMHPYLLRSYSAGTARPQSRTQPTFFTLTDPILQAPDSHPERPER